MFLNKLFIFNEDVVVREISFHKGINLIVDETTEKDPTKSGNNVGKTTVLRLIDYCLGSGGKNIYHDEEFKNHTNIEVEKFLTENNIIIQLNLVESLDDGSSNTIVIRRNFLKYGAKIQTINDKPYKNDKIFQHTLKELIFSSDKDKPTFKQIISKNIRDEKNRLSHTLRVLNPYTSNDEYEALYLFWLGLDLDFASRKQTLFQEIKIEENLQKRLKKESTIPQLEQYLIILSRNIEELESKKSAFNLNENYEEELNQLNQTKIQLNNISTEIGRLELRKELIIESKEDLEADLANIDINKVKSLYNKAQSLIPDLQKTFEETLSFHNQMIKEKLKFITKEIPDIDKELKALKSNTNELLKTERFLSSKLTKSGAVKELQAIITALNDEYEKKGKYEEQKRMWETSLQKVKNKTEELDKINEGIEAKDDLIKSRIETFNKYFSNISKKLYNEQFVLTPEINEKGYSLEISSIDGNPGTGKKKGEILSFDLAYIQFAEELDIKHLSFVLHDQIENVHENQISLLLNEVVENMNCQIVLSVLRDKLPSTIPVKDFEIISLSQDDKLFRI